MMSGLFQCGVLTFLLISSVAGNSGTRPQQAQASWNTYEVVVERNIFRRDRGRATEDVLAADRQPTVPPERYTVPPERYIVLTGIVRQGNQHMAFLEDIRTGITTRARVGDPVAQGRVKSITLDCLEYQSKDSVATIQVGSNLEGGVSAPGVPYESLEAGGASELGAPGASAGGAPVSADEAAILERLRQKREKELAR